MTRLLQSSFKNIQHGLILGLGYFLLVWGGIELTREAGRICSIWPATAFTLAFLLRCPRKEWPSLLICALIGGVVARMIHDDGALRTLLVSPISIIEAGLCAHILRRYTNEEFDLREYRHLLIFGSVALVLPIASTLWAATYFQYFHGFDFQEIATTWYLSDALGLIIFTPLFFMIGWDELKMLSSPDTRNKCIALFVMLAIVVSGVFLQSSYPLLFLVFPVMALSAFWLGTCGAVIALAITTVVSIACTIHGTGPITLIHGSLAEKTLVLQGFLATAALISLPIATALSYRTQLEESLKEAKHIADQANLAKSRFLTSMSHEFRTPLNAILGFSQLVGMDKGLSEKAREHIGYVTTGGEHLLKLVEDVMDLAKIEAGIITTKQEKISCRDLLDEVTELVRPLAEKRQITISAFYPDNLYVSADRSRLMQVLVNLLSNAIKYNREKGQVSVTAEVQGDYIRMKVTDSGIGIALEMQDKVFEPFNRLGAEATDIEGTGIGLAISKQLVEAMQGRIGFSSVEADGSEFYVDMPLLVSEILVDHVMEGNIEASSKISARILYIEDNKANAELMRNIAQDFLNADIRIVGDGRSGLRQAREFAPDVIISDIHLTDMSGHEILKSLREHPLTAQIPVMALTADAGFLKNKKAGDFDRVMSKPFQLKELMENIEYLLKTA